MSKVLLVDDDQNILRSFSRVLEKEFELLTAAGGEEGLDILEKHGSVAVVVSDLKMPQMDGISFLTQVRERFPDTIRMILTGYADIENAIDAVNQGYIFRFLTKPCAVELLAQAIREGIALHDLHENKAELLVLKRMHEAMEGVIDAFSAIVEARDPYTAGHQHRVMELALAIADKLELSADRKEGLKMAAMVHDIGKLYVPSEFLNKPGRLTDAEFTIIKSHPAVGYDILKPVSFPWPVAEMVRQHHERANGSGYPDGITNNEILLESKILAVADVVEAMGTHRPYRPALGLKKALAEIEKNSGELYDEKVVKACLALFKDDGYVLDSGGSKEVPMLIWTEQYSVGVETIDEEHKHLIDLINKAYAAIEDKEDDDTLRLLVADMWKYAMNHFATEEVLMDRYDYPDMARHKKEHNQFTKYVAENDISLASPGEALEAAKIFKYLSEWLTHHIMEVDKEFGVFLQEKGVE